MKTIIATALIVLSAPLSNARLNETLDQCIARYGQPTDKVKEAGVAQFEKNGIEILAHFFEGKVDMIAFTNPGGKEFTADEGIYFFKANLGPDCVIAGEEGSRSLIAASFDQKSSGRWTDDRDKVICLTAAFTKRSEVESKNGGSRLKGF